MNGVRRCLKAESSLPEQKEIPRGEVMTEQAKIKT